MHDSHGGRMFEESEAAVNNINPDSLNPHSPINPSHYPSEYKSQAAKTPDYHDSPEYRKSLHLEGAEKEAQKYEAPKYETPTEAPTYEAPKYEAPKYEAPKYETPTETPTYEAPKYEAPTEVPYVTEAPTYETEAPVYETEAP